MLMGISGIPVAIKFIGEPCKAGALASILLRPTIFPNFQFASAIPAESVWIGCVSTIDPLPSIMTNDTS